MAEPSLKILILFILIILQFIVSQLNLHFSLWKNSAICSKQSPELEGAFLCSSLCSMAQQKEKVSPVPEWGSSTVTLTVPVSVPLTDTGHRMALRLTWAFIYQIPCCDCHLHTAVVLGIFGFSVLCPRVLCLLFFCHGVLLQFWFAVCGESLEMLCLSFWAEYSPYLLCGCLWWQRLCSPIQCFCFNIGIVKFISVLYLLTSIFIFAVCCVN